MRLGSHHTVRTTDAVATTLEGCWAYSPHFNDWEYILWVEPGAFHVLDIFGREHTHSHPFEIEALSPLPVEGTTNENYIERLRYHRAEAGWNY